MQDLKNIIESLLFVSDEPLTVESLKSILDNCDTKQIKQSLEQLCDDYDARGGGFHLREVAGGWQLRSRPAYHPWIKQMLQPSPQRLSRAALETLAIIAYKQPIIRADIEHIRGVDSGGVLRQLMERKLVRVLGRKEIPGRPLIYATTKLFLELFDLKDLNDLPSPKEIQELSAEFGRQEETAYANSDNLALSGNETEMKPEETESVEHFEQNAEPSQDAGSETEQTASDDTGTDEPEPDELQTTIDKPNEVQVPDIDETIDASDEPLTD